MEVLNTGFFKVFRSIDRYNSTQGTLYTWIRTIVVNSCLDHIRTKQKQRGNLGKVFHHELQGSRELKYKYLLDTSLHNIPWTIGNTGHYHAIKVGMCAFMVNSAIIRILHG